MFCFSFSCAYLLHGNCLLTRFNFSIKILLAKTTFLFWTFLCCLVSTSSFCIGSISWCCFVVLFFRCSSHVTVFCGIPIVSPVFRRCPMFHSSVLRGSWFYSMPILSSLLLIVITCIAWWEGMEMLKIFAYDTVVYFTDQNWTSKTVYRIPWLYEVCDGL